MAHFFGVRANVKVDWLWLEQLPGHSVLDFGREWVGGWGWVGEWVGMGCVSKNKTNFAPLCQGVVHTPSGTVRALGNTLYTALSRISVVCCGL